MHKYFAFYLLFSFLFLCLVLPARAQSESEELNSDRPSRSQGPTVIPQGTLQIETGLQYQKDEKDEFLKREYLYPEALIRIGLLEWAELRLATEFKEENQEMRTGSLAGRLNSERGFNNVQVGAKINFYQGQGAIPEVGFLGNITLPVGAESFRPTHVAPEGSLLFNNKITEKLSLQYNIGYGKQQGNDEYQGQLFYGAELDFKITDKLQGFGEFFSQKAKASPAENIVDIGLMVLLFPNLQFDVIAGTGVSQQAPRYFVGTGLTWRLPR